MRAIFISALRALGLVVEIEGCAWRRFMGDFSTAAYGPNWIGPSGGVRHRPHWGPIPPQVRWLFARIYFPIRGLTFPVAPWHGAKKVVVPSGAFSAMISDLAWLEHRLGSDVVTDGLTPEQAALARALAGELLDVLGGVLTPELERRWPRRIAEAEAVGRVEVERRRAGAEAVN